MRIQNISIEGAFQHKIQQNSAMPPIFCLYLVVISGLGTSTKHFFFSAHLRATSSGSVPVQVNISVTGCESMDLSHAFHLANLLSLLERRDPFQHT